MLEFLGMFNIIFWKWYPLPSVNWIIHPNPWVGLSIALILGTPCMLVMTLGLIHAGKESWEPHREKVMQHGIYKYIRHPQAIGEFPFFVVLAFGVNSWFLVIMLTIYNIIYLPIMKSIEEADLIRRFGQDYIEYQNKTGAFLPKMKNK